MSFAREDYTLEKFDNLAEDTKRVATKNGAIQGSFQGVFMVAMFCFFMYCYAIGSYLIQQQVYNSVTGAPYTVVEIVTISQSTIIALMVFAGLMPIIPAIVKALISGK